MPYSLELVQDDIIAQLDTLPQPNYEVAIPDAETLVRVNGRLDPYFAYQFGDPRPTADHSMVSVADDDHTMTIYIQAIAHEPKTARLLGNDLTQLLNGYSVPYGGQVRKSQGLGVLPVTASTGSTEAFMMPVSFIVTLQLLNL